MTAGETLYNLYLEYVGTWTGVNRAWADLMDWEQARWEQLAAVV